jgi:hypothetical protein
LPDAPAHTPLTPGQRRTLTEVARASIAHGLSHGLPLPTRAEDYEPALRAIRGTFVTLDLDGALRGCIGSLEAHQPLVEDVARHAFDAAFRDPRFLPVTAAEAPRLELHISVLSPNEPLVLREEADLLRQLRPGVDGLIIAQGRHRATFLPSVWESLPEPTQFLAHLKRKAGIPPAPSDEPLRAWRYTTESFSDAEPGEAAARAST